MNDSLWTGIATAIYGGSRIEGSKCDNYQRATLTAMTLKFENPHSEVHVTEALL